jgi:hypothetical protein
MSGTTAELRLLDGQRQETVLKIEDQTAKCPEISSEIRMHHANTAQSPINCALYRSKSW